MLGVVNKTDEDETGRPNTIITLAESFSWFTSDERGSLMERRLGHIPVEKLAKEVQAVFPNATAVVR